MGRPKAKRTWKSLEAARKRGAATVEYVPIIYVKKTRRRRAYLRTGKPIKLDEGWF